MSYNFSGLKRFDVKFAEFEKYLLNGSISAAFEEKAYLERKHKRLYEDLCSLNLDANVFSWLIHKCREVFYSTISGIRPRQVRKYQKLLNDVRESQRAATDVDFVCRRFSS